MAKPRKMAESAVFLTMDSVHQRRFVTETEIVVHTNFLAVSPVSVIFALLNSNMHGLNEIKSVSRPYLAYTDRFYMPQILRVYTQKYILSRDSVCIEHIESYEYNFERNI